MIGERIGQTNRIQEVRPNRGIPIQSGPGKVTVTRMSIMLVHSILSSKDDGGLLRDGHGNIHALPRGFL